MSVRIFSCLILGGALLALPAARAAERVVYSSTTRQTAAEVEDIGEIAETDASKGGVSKETQPEEKHFRLNVGARAQYTSNARLSGNHGSSDVIFLPNVEAGYKLPLTQTITLDTVARLESGIYVREDERTFLGYSIQSTLDYRPRPGLPRVFIGVEPYRYDGFDGQERITQAIAVSAGTDWGYGFNNGNSLFFVGYTFTEHFADPAMDLRSNHAALVGLTHVLTPRLTGQAFYQFQYDTYENIARRDFRHIVGLSLTYQLTRNLFTTVTGNFTDSDSDQRRASYQSANASLGLNYQF